ncbi:hypothetical protein BSFA1_71650 (plasmid) [Burkholderia sp. SFA1]|nr:hypothetical protein BSFA1_71650 [Burkholderia sp. SFA1]
MFGAEYVGKTDTQKEADPLQMLPLSDERAHERHRLCMRLTPHHGIAWTNECAEFPAVAGAMDIDRGFSVVHA